MADAVPEPTPAPAPAGTGAAPKVKSAISSTAGAISSIESTQKTILAVMGGTVAITLLARMVASKSQKVKQQGAIPRIMMGGLVGSIGLMALAKANQNLAKGIAYLVLLGTVYTYGPIILAEYRKPLNKNFTVMTAEEWQDLRKKQLDKNAKVKGKTK